MKIDVNQLPFSADKKKAGEVIELFNIYGWEPFFIHYHNGHAKFKKEKNTIEIWFTTLTIKETVDGIDVFDKKSNLERIENIINNYE